ncbi:MAG: hypothetical protein NG740_02880 [Omnitrophica bacterium]|nr:hypothetical protein [Candidatus Omnitrophota bacterium]
MNVATGTLTLLGMVFLVIGLASKLIGVSLLSPLFATNSGYLTAANSCFLLALVVDRFNKA